MFRDGKRNTKREVANLEPSEDVTEFRTIGELATKYEISIRSLRFYEFRGLLEPKRKGKVRLYDEEQENRLLMIMKGRRFGFTLAEIRDLLLNDAYFELDNKQIITQIAYLKERRKEINHAIAELQKNMK